jgi:hypothetical protein
MTGVQRIRIARCAEMLSVALMPAWMPPEVWAALSVSLRDALVGASWVQDVLYGATPIQTAVLNDDRTGAIDHIIAMYAAEYHPMPTAPQVAPENDAAAAPATTLSECALVPAAEPSLPAIQPDTTVSRQEIAALVPQELSQPAEPCDLMGVSVPLVPDTAPPQPTHDTGVMSAAMAENGDAGVINTASKDLPLHAAPPDSCSADIPVVGFTIQRPTNTADRSVPDAAPQEPMPSAAGIAGTESMGHRRPRRPHLAHRVGWSRQKFIFSPRHVGSTRQISIGDHLHVGFIRQNYSPHIDRVGSTRQIFIGDDLRVGSTRQKFIFSPRHVGSTRQMFIGDDLRVEYSQYMAKRDMLMIREGTDAHIGVVPESATDRAHNTVAVNALARLIADRNKERGEKRILMRRYICRGHFGGFCISPQKGARYEIEWNVA